MDLGIWGFGDLGIKGFRDLNLQKSLKSPKSSKSPKSPSLQKHYKKLNEKLPENPCAWADV